MCNSIHLRQVFILGSSYLEIDLMEMIIFMFYALLLLQKIYLEKNVEGIAIAQH
jgi:hypothetical protein